jgi:hypothetical protein
MEVSARWDVRLDPQVEGAAGGVMGGLVSAPCIHYICKNRLLFKI